MVRGAFAFEVDWTEHYLRFDLQRICAPDAEKQHAPHLKLFGNRYDFRYSALPKASLVKLNIFTIKMALFCFI